MTRPSHLAVFLVVSMIGSRLVAQGTQPPRIFSIEPVSGPTSGGSLVTITGENFLPRGGQCGVQPSCGAGVKIGFSGTDIIEETDTRILLRTQPNPAGTFDVTLFRNTDGGFVIAHNAFTFGQTEYERVLLPVVVRSPIPGALSSRWTSEFVVSNLMSSPLRVSQRPDSPCATPCREEVAPYSQQSIALEPPAPGAGTFVYVPKIRSASLNLRIQDVSRQAQTWGTEIQTVLEKDLITTWLQLVNIPGGDRFRQTLRIYDFDVYQGATFILTLLPSTGNTPLVSHNVTIPSSRPSVYPDFPMHPTMIQIDLTEMFPQMRTQERARLHIDAIDITPVRYWGFISVINNETQHVTTITPQRLTPVR